METERKTLPGIFCFSPVTSFVFFSSSHLLLLVFVHFSLSDRININFYAEKVRNGVHDWDLLKNDERMDVLREEENVVSSKYSKSSNLLYLISSLLIILIITSILHIRMEMTNE